LSRALQTLAPHRAAYRLLESEFELRSDSRDLVERFDHLYCRFRIASSPDGTPAYLLLVSPQPFGRPAFLANEDPLCFDDLDLLFEYAHTWVLKRVAAEVRHHLLIHAAALSFDQAGVILAGGTGCGKTTLTLELVRQGFQFLSDDVAVIGLADGNLVPFPRSLGIWPATFLATNWTNSTNRYSNSSNSSNSWQALRLVDQNPVRGPTPGRAWVDIETLFPGRLSPPCPARYLVRLMAGEASSASRPLELYLTVDRTPRDWLAALSALPQIRDLSILRNQRLPVVRLPLQEAMGVEPAVETLCRQHGVILFDMSRQETSPPDFDVAPCLTPTSSWDGVLVLLQHLRGGAGSALVQDGFQGNLARLALSLGRLTEQMACFRLRMGRLKETADLVCQVVEHGTP
jgi:hypothetical protein